MIGPPSIELESLSDALSRSAMFLSDTNDDGNDDDGNDDDGNDDEDVRRNTADYPRLLIARNRGHECYSPVRSRSTQLRS